MDKFKEFGRKKFVIACLVLVAIAVVGWAFGWWSSPPAV